jgi:hypothetical protein
MKLLIIQIPQPLATSFAFGPDILLSNLPSKAFTVCFLSGGQTNFHTHVQNKGKM